VPPLMLLHAVQKQLAVVNPDQQTYSVARDVETWITDLPEWQLSRLAAWTFGSLAWLPLALAAVGLYSVVSYAVAQRTSEFGIRMALGTQPTQVMRLVFASMVVSVGSGIATGQALTLIMDRILESWAGGNARDPIILVGGSAAPELGGHGCRCDTGPACVPAKSVGGVTERVNNATGPWVCGEEEEGATPNGIGRHWPE